MPFATVTGQPRGLEPRIGIGIGPFTGPESLHEVPRLAVDYALTERLTVGAAPLLSVLTSNDAVVLGLAPRIGYVLRPSRSVMFWPRVGLSYAYTVRNAPPPNPLGCTDVVGCSYNAGTALNPEVHQLAVSFDASFVFAIVDHAGITFGPVFEGSLTNRTPYVIGADQSTAFFGLYGGLVGWF